MSSPVGRGHPGPHQIKLFMFICLTSCLELMAAERFTAEASDQAVNPQEKGIIITQEPKKTWNGNVQTNVRTNNSERCEGTPHENMDFETQRPTKLTRTSPQTLPCKFIAMLAVPPNYSITLKKGMLCCSHLSFVAYSPLRCRDTHSHCK